MRPGWRTSTPRTSSPTGSERMRTTTRTRCEAVNLQFKALTPSQQNGVEGADLKDRANSLQILSQLQSGEVQLEQAAAAPSGPLAPRCFETPSSGRLLGLLIGLAAAFLLQHLDRRLREPSDLEDVYAVPLLGVVPESPALRRAQESGDHTNELPPNEAEIFGLLRAHIRYFNVDRDLRTVVIVSAAPGDGKSTVAAVPGDGHGDGRISRPLPRGRPPASDGRASTSASSRRRGYRRCWSARSRSTSAAQRVEIASRKGTEVGLDVLVAGGVLPPNPPQVIESQAMASLIVDARDSYDLVVIDTPPLVLLPDAFPLLRQADGVLIVSRLGREPPGRGGATARHPGERGGAGRRRDRQRIQATARVRRPTATDTATSTTTRNTMPFST